MNKMVLSALIALCCSLPIFAQLPPENKPQIPGKVIITPPFPDPGITGLIIQQLTFTDYEASDPNPEGQENYRQCDNGGTGPRWDWLTDWTRPIRLTTDWRSGGCDYKLAVVDSGDRFSGTILQLAWGPDERAVDAPASGGGSAECLFDGTYELSVGHGFPKRWMRRVKNSLGGSDNQEFIRIDTDTRPHACPLTFQVFSEPKNKIVEWSLRVFNPGTHADKAICGDASNPPGSPARIARVGQPVTYKLNMHDGQTCEFTMRFDSYPAATVSPGDTLGGIAHKHLKSAKRWKEIQILNPSIADPDKIPVGMKLKLPN